MNPALQQPTAEELALAYRQAKLRYIGVSLFKALNTPVLYRSLVRQAIATRKTALLTQHHHIHHTETEAA